MSPTSVLSVPSCESATPERLMRMAWGFAPPLMIQAAVRLGVFDRLAAVGGAGLAELAAAAGAAPRGLAALLDGLVGLALLRKDEAGRYELVPESARFLVRGRPEYHGSYFRHVSTALLPDWLRIEDAVRTGRPTGSTDPAAVAPELLAEAVEAMFGPSYAAACSLAEHLLHEQGEVADARQPVRVLDVSAGSAVWSVALAQASDQVRVTAIDRAGVLEVAARNLHRLGLLPRYRLVDADPVEAALEPDQHIVLLGHVLHSCTPEGAEALVRRSFAALRPGGTVAIAEHLVDWRRTEPALSLVFNVNMLLRSPGGGTYSFEEIGAWLRIAGFRDVRAFDAPAPSPLVLATRPS